MSKGSMKPKGYDLEAMMDRFWSKVDTSGDCWEWQGGLTNGGYGVFTIKEWPFKAHRILWEYIHGPIPEGMCVCHTCDDRRCVNPDHLWLGTIQDNLSDMVRKGRSLVGERNPKARFDETTVRYVLQRVANGKKGIRVQLARELGCPPSRIYEIVERQSWAHVAI